MNKYWFRKRRGLLSPDLGWGWVPVSWEGFVTILVFIILVFASVFVIGVYNEPVSTAKFVSFLITLLVLIVLLAFVAKKKEMPDKMAHKLIKEGKFW